MILGVDNIDEFKVFFDVIHEDTGDIEFQVSKDKILCSVLNKSHTNFFEVEFDEDFFSVFDVDDMDRFSVSVDDLYKLLKSLKKTDNLTLEVDESYLIAVVESENGNRRVFEYTLQDILNSTPSFPSINFDTEFSVDTSDLKQSVTDLKLIGTDKYKMVVSGDSLFISSSNDALTKYSHEIYISPEIPTKAIVSVINVDYIEKMLKFNKVNKVVEIKFGDGKPLSYFFKGVGVEIRGLIANLIEED